MKTTHFKLLGFEIVIIFKIIARVTHLDKKEKQCLQILNLKNKLQCLITKVDYHFNQFYIGI